MNTFREYITHSFKKTGSKSTILRNQHEISLVAAARTCPLAVTVCAGLRCLGGTLQQKLPLGAGRFIDTHLSFIKATTKNI